MPMTTEKIKQAFYECAQLIKKEYECDEENEDKVPHPHRIDPGLSHISAKDVCAHLLWMCQAGSVMAETKREKAMRWLGFVQGSLWIFYGISIDTLKELNKPDKAMVLSATDAED